MHMSKTLYKKLVIKDYNEIIQKLEDQISKGWELQMVLPINGEYTAFFKKEREEGDYSLFVRKDNDKK